MTLVHVARCRLGVPAGAPKVLDKARKGGCKGEVWAGAEEVDCVSTEQELGDEHIVIVPPVPLQDTLTRKHRRFCACIWRFRDHRIREILHACTTV